ncbi:MAG TPA: DUF1490 family protein [Aldersonia sp.]
MAYGLLAKAASLVVTGAVGAAAYDAAKRAARRVSVHDAAVTATAWGLRGTRKAEQGAESARLKLADVVAEAKERVGEEAAPPAAPGAGHDHDHDH